MPTSSTSRCVQASSPQSLYRQIVLVLCALLLVAQALLEVSAPRTTSATTAIRYNRKAGHIVVQLFSVPGLLFPPINGIPEWTLYGDGTLITRSFSTDNLVQAWLSSAEVQRILDVVVRQNRFFASTRPSYGQPIPDAGITQLTVTASGRSKTVNLLVDPGSPTDPQTRHVFAIKQFLLGYRAARTRLYTPPGVALLALSPEVGHRPDRESPWGIKDISLAGVAAQECDLLPLSQPCPAHFYGKTGIFPVYGPRGVALLPHPNPYSYRSEDGTSYLVLVYPLLPDALVRSSSGGYTVQINGSRLPLLAGPGSGKL